MFLSQETKEHYKVDENDGMFEKECEEEVDDDLYTCHSMMCKPTKSLATYHANKEDPGDVLLCNSSSDLSLFY